MALLDFQYHAKFNLDFFFPFIAGQLNTKRIMDRNLKTKKLLA